MTTCVPIPPPGFLDTTHGPVILDGAMGTALHARGLPRDVLAEKWVLDHPAEIIAVHQAHVDAGAQALLTCTFMTHPGNLRSSSLHSFPGEIRRVAVECARAANPKYVLGVIGPLPPSTDPALVSASAEAAAWDFMRAGVDGLVLETIVQLPEGIARVAGAASMGIPVVASVVPGTAAGDDGKEAARALRKAGAHVVGVNCAAPSDCARVLRSMREAGPGHLWAKPSGIDGFVERSVKLLELGVRYLGGCCGTTARDIAGIAHAVTRT